jgi:hypothetical protein
MERISIQIDSPGYIKVSEIGNELLSFAMIIDNKYSQIDFEFAFYFRALYTTRGINSKVRFYKEEPNRWLGMDLIMAEDEFNPYKNNVLMQRLIMGNHFFPFFVENIKKYKNKLPTLKPVDESLIEEMRLFLIDNFWLKENENEPINFNPENWTLPKAEQVFGKPFSKKVTDEIDKEIHFDKELKAIKYQNLIWYIDCNRQIECWFYLNENKIWLCCWFDIKTNY